jgi:hypothetical protein
MAMAVAAFYALEVAFIEAVIATRAGFCESDWTRGGQCKESGKRYEEQTFHD